MFDRILNTPLNCTFLINECHIRKILVFAKIESLLYVGIGKSQDEN